MSEKRILLASLLKPINDTRMYEKLGLSLSKLPHISIHIAGYQAPSPAGAPANISFYPVFSFRRLSLGRAQAQLIYWRLLLKVRPDIIIVTTHELLALSALYKKLYTCKLVYDIQENYTLNLRAQNSYTSGIKELLAAGVGSIEKFTAPAVDHFLVAEKSYLQELTFLDDRYTLLENKYKPRTKYTTPATPVKLIPGQPLKLLYSGTISEVYGVFEAINLTEQLHTLYPQISLTIIGYCAQTHTLNRLRQALQDKPYIRLIGGPSLVPHQQIIAEIEQSHLALLPYQPNESTFRCIPTKLYEYMAHALPMLVQRNPLWHQLLEQAQAGISINFAQFDAAVILQQLFERTYYSAGVPANVFWEQEDKKLLALMGKLLQKITDTGKEKYF